jgi:hypothetical protein
MHLWCFSSVHIDYADYVSIDYIRTMILTNARGLTTILSPIVVAILRQQLAYLYGCDSSASMAATHGLYDHDSGPPQGLHRHIHGFASLEGSPSHTQHRSGA